MIIRTGGQVEISVQFRIGEKHKIPAVQKCLNLVNINTSGRHHLYRRERLIFLRNRPGKVSVSFGRSFLAHCKLQDALGLAD